MDWTNYDTKNPAWLYVFKSDDKFVLLNIKDEPIEYFITFEEGIIFATNNLGLIYYDF